MKAYAEELFSSNSIHGCSYLSNKTLHIVERVSWLIILQLALIGTIYSCMIQYSRYRDRPTVMTVEKDFRTWQGILPGVTICPLDVLDVNRANDYIDILYGDNITDVDRESTMKLFYALVNATAENYEQLAEYGSDEKFGSINLTEVSLNIRKPISKLIKASTHNSKALIEVQPVITEIGFCYALNSVLSAVTGDRSSNRNELRKPLFCQYGKQECFLRFEVFETEVSVEVHSPYEFPIIKSTQLTLEKSVEVYASYKVMQTVASDSLRDLSTQQRKCLFPEEGTPLYSRTLCYMKCRGKVAMEMCDCVPHFYGFIDGPSCTPSGYECLLDFKWPGWSLNLCNCSRTCEQLIYPSYKMQKRRWNPDSNFTFISKSTLHLELMPPKARNRISVVFSFEDLLVSFGGAASLFLGFSFWTVFHLIYSTARRFMLKKDTPIK